jgi:hypothetical protein
VAVDQPSATTSAAAPAQPQDQARPDATAVPAPRAADTASAAAPVDAANAAAESEQPQPAGFGSRGRARRRARFLRKARELAYRDLGGLVFSLHRFGQRNDALVLAKLGTLGRIDAELRALEAHLGERQPVTVLREAGITACPRCAAIHSGEDRFCPNCGLSMSRKTDLPIAGAPPAGQSVAAPSAPLAAPQAAPAPGPPASAASSSAAPPFAPQTPAVPAPATQAFEAVPAPGGEDDQPTEIIRPPKPGS